MSAIYWDEFCRTQLRAELDAYYARLYVLARDELRYTLRVDPKEVLRRRPFDRLRATFPCETFRVPNGEGSQAIWGRFAQDETSSVGGGLG